MQVQNVNTFDALCTRFVQDWAAVFLQQVRPRCFPLSPTAGFAASSLPATLCLVLFLLAPHLSPSNSSQSVARKESAVVLEVCGPNWRV